jgi:hypothetical protein
MLDNREEQEHDDSGAVDEMRRIFRFCSFRSQADGGLEGCFAAALLECLAV